MSRRSLSGNRYTRIRSLHRSCKAPGHDRDGSYKALSYPFRLHFLQFPRHSAQFRQAQAAYDLLDKQSAACLSCPPQQGSKSGQPVAENRRGAADWTELSSHTFNEVPTLLDLAGWLARTTGRMSMSRPEDTLSDLMKKHLSTTTNEVVARLNKDREADVRAFDEVYQYRLHMADALSDGIVKQFANKFT
jgi:hypothetical protein